MNERWTAAVCFAIVVLLMCVGYANAAPRDPTGQFSISPAPHHEGDTIGFVLEVRGATRNDEVTLGIWCVQPDGSALLWGNRGNPGIYEFNYFGAPRYTDETPSSAVVLPVTGTGYDCTAGLVVVDWFKGAPLEAWRLDQDYFTVEGSR